MKMIYMVQISSFDFALNVPRTKMSVSHLILSPYTFVRRNIALNAFRHIILRNFSNDGSRYYIDGFFCPMSRGGFIVTKG